MEAVLLKQVIDVNTLLEALPLFISLLRIWKSNSFYFLPTYVSNLWPLGLQLSFKSSQSSTLIRWIEVGSAGKDNKLGHVKNLRLSRQERSFKLGRDWIPQFMKHRCWTELKLSDLSNKMNGLLQHSSVTCAGIAKPSVDSMSLSIMELLFC